MSERDFHMGVLIVETLQNNSVGTLAVASNLAVGASIDS
jgi:hypothetical protein